MYERVPYGYTQNHFVDKRYSSSSYISLSGYCPFREMNLYPVYPRAPLSPWCPRKVYIKTELNSLHVLQVGIAGAQMVCEPASPIPTI
jgi:hypothetical protein